MTEQVKANPTKEFFIDMITRDISLERSILDLIDNSVDAAVRDNFLATREIKIRFDEHKFIIWDNCGGFKKDDALNHAFKFGRDHESPPTPHSVGQFGVGLKRTLFKLGRNFTVSSKKDRVGFSVICDVNAWMSQNDWIFELNSQLEEGVEEGQTLIKVESLKESTELRFKNPKFEEDLYYQISMAHFSAIQKGLKIYLNDKLVETKYIYVKKSDVIPAQCFKYEFNDVTILIKAGVTDRSFEDGGWYISCNGRLVVSADQGEITGWGHGIPKYHADFAFFRGLVEFDSTNSALLPWTTTKTGIDYGHPLYQRALVEMREITRRYQTFLRERAREISDIDSGIIDENPISQAIVDARMVNIIDLDESSAFDTPAPAVRPDQEQMISVQYQVSRRRAEVARDVLGVTSAREVGRQTFEYFFEKECGNE